jgi:hypothetical protein
MCAPPDFADLLARVGVPMVPAGKSVRDLVHGVHDRKPSTPADAPRVAAELVAAQFETVAAAAEGCDALVASGLMPAGVRTVAEVRDIPYVLVAFHPGSFPSPHHVPLPRPGKPFPPGVTDKRVLWDVDAERVQALYGAPLNAHRATLGLPPVDNVRDHVFTDSPWLAADRSWLRGLVRRTSMWCRPVRGSCPMSANSLPTWRPSSTQEHRRCTRASAVCAPRMTPPGWPSRRSERKGAVQSSPAAGPTLP